MDLCATKQKEAETFATFLQRQRGLYRRCLTHIPDAEQVDIFNENMVASIKYLLQMQCMNNLKDITEKGIKCEKSLLEQGILKHQNDSRPTTSTSNERPKFWSRNKNVTNDKVVDAHIVNRAQPVISLQGPNDKNQSQTNDNVLQSNNPRPPRIGAPRRNFTPPREPIESTLKKLIWSNAITLPEARPYEPCPFKPAWWNDNDFYEYHCNKGHKTTTCYKLKNLIQDLIDQGEITVDNKATNINHTIFKDPFVKHDKGKASSSNTQDNTANYTNVSFDYAINMLSEGHKMVATITVNPRSRYK